MEPLTITSIILFIIGYIFNAGMDTLQHKHSGSVFQKSKPLSFFGSLNAFRKYKNMKPIKTYLGLHDRLENAPNTWYYRFFNIPYKEKFPLSATALVFLADGWHFFQWMMYNCFSVAIALLVPDHKVIVFIIIRFGGSAMFELFYSKILRK